MAEKRIKEAELGVPVAEQKKGQLPLFSLQSIQSDARDKEKNRIDEDFS